MVSHTKKNDFKPGFSLSNTDALVLAAGICGAVLLFPHFPRLAVAILFVVSHFFLFCNVVRMARPSELIWAATFTLLSLGAMRFEWLPWSLVLLLSLVLTVALVFWETKKPRYHGVLWQKFNPNLASWFENRS